MVAVRSVGELRRTLKHVRPLRMPVSHQSMQTDPGLEVRWFFLTRYKFVSAISHGRLSSMGSEKHKHSKEKKSRKEKKEKKRRRDVDTESEPDSGDDSADERKKQKSEKMVGELHSL